MFTTLIVVMVTQEYMYIPQLKLTKLYTLWHVYIPFCILFIPQQRYGGKRTNTVFISKRFMKKQIKKGKKNHICLNMKTRSKQVVEIS